MASHMVYTPEPLNAEAMSPAQQYFIGMFEDARVEYCAGSEFPGMKGLWQTLMTLPGERSHEHESMALLERTALALLDAAEKTGDPEVDRLVERFHTNIANNRDNVHFSIDLGLDLFNLLNARRAVPSLRILEGLNIPYRDDNRFIWSAEEFSWEQTTAYLPESQRQVRKHVSVMEMVNEVEVETAGDDAQEIWILSSELFPYEDEGISYNQMEGKEPVSDPFHYPEWDYHVQLHRPAWATVFERRQGRGDPDLIDKVLTEHKGVSHRIKQIIDRLRPQGTSRQRRLEDGDELDINAAVDAMVTLRIGLQPDMRITMRHVINRRDLAVLILLDLSESTNETVRGTEKTVLELTREACALVATAIDGIGDPFAIHGFASDGRHDVQYYRFKDFEQRLDDDVKSRLAGMKGGLSTRMGAADPEADRYVSRIFGANNYTIIDNVQRLPEKLPTLFASLTR